MKKLVLTIAICGLLYNVAYAWGEGRPEYWDFSNAVSPAKPKSQTQGKKKVTKNSVQNTRNEEWDFSGAVTFSVEYKEAQARIKNGIKQNNVQAVIKEMDKNKNLLYSLDENGNTPLHLAVSSGNFNMVKALIDKGARLGVRNHQMQTPLCLAADMKYPVMVEYMLYNKNMNQRIIQAKCSNNKTVLDKAVDDRGNTLLHWAIWRQKTGTVRMLVDQGAPMGVKNNGGQTPLCLAAALNYPYTLQYMLRSPNMNKKIVNVKCNNGEHALQTITDAMGDKRDAKLLYILIGDFVNAGLNGRDLTD